MALSHLSEQWDDAGHLQLSIIEEAKAPDAGKASAKMTARITRKRPKRTPYTSTYIIYRDGKFSNNIINLLKLKDLIATLTL